MKRRDSPPFFFPDSFKKNFEDTSRLFTLIASKNLSPLNEASWIEASDFKLLNDAPIILKLPSLKTLRSPRE